MLVAGIKSKPVSTTLKPDPSGLYHLLVGQGSGGEALLRLLRAMPAGAEVHVLYATEPFSGKDWSEQLGESWSDLRVFPTQAEIVSKLDGTLSRCITGTRLYIAGSESFIGSAVQIAMTHHLNSDELQCEHCGSTARRVYCIHCRTLNEKVTTNIATCTGCSRHLLVGNHYSGRLGAYMGVMVDAEAPGELPSIEEVFV